MCPERAPAWRLAHGIELGCIFVPAEDSLPVVLTPSELADLVPRTLGFAIKIFTYLFYGDEILNIYFLMKSIN